MRGSSQINDQKCIYFNIISHFYVKFYLIVISTAYRT